MVLWLPLPMLSLITGASFSLSANLASDTKALVSVAADLTL